MGHVAVNRSVGVGHALSAVAEQMEHLLPVMISTEAEEDTANPREIMARFVRSPKVEQDGALGTQDMDVEMVAT
ncbi:hypothetical protein EHS25_002762 [Saitozyma podzolica]|uniref:Uncharacterized protein n=1 Tax=Saitozyma podzolica TaxID=1890683 RepID=A0A427YDE9_9TREE|nr:hypothetical protein EHS25_002762 [Saitozyma podzolica]